MLVIVKLTDVKRWNHKGTSKTQLQVHFIIALIYKRVCLTEIPNPSPVSWHTYIRSLPSPYSHILNLKRWKSICCHRGILINHCTLLIKFLFREQNMYTFCTLDKEIPIRWFNYEQSDSESLTRSRLFITCLIDSWWDGAIFIRRRTDRRAVSLDID